MTVHQASGKTFQRRQKVTTGVKKHAKHEGKLSKDPGADKAALQKYAADAPNEAAREAVLDAEWNTPKGDSTTDYTPQERRIKTVERLAAAWRDATVAGNKDGSADYLEEVLGHFDAEAAGPDPGETVEFNGRDYEADHSVLSGPVEVVRQPIVLNGDGYKHVAIKGLVTKVKEAREDTQLVTVHRDGKTFQERRKKADPEPDTGEVPKGLVAKAKAVAQRVAQRARELAVKLTPAGMKIGAALGVVFDTPEDMKKFAYNPTVTGGKAATNDFVAANMHDAFGVGVSGHIVASVVAHVLTKAVFYAKRKLAGEEADTGIMEFAEFLAAVYKMVFEELGLHGQIPQAAQIAEALADHLRGA